MKVSFDFDYTLSKPAIQKLAEVFNKHCEVWIVTSRMYSDGGWNQELYSNDDLFEIADKLNIPWERIVFTNLQPKYKFFKDKDFHIHFDDDEVEINEINIHTNTKGILI